MRVNKSDLGNSGKLEIQSEIGIEQSQHLRAVLKDGRLGLESVFRATHGQPLTNVERDEFGVTDAEEIQSSEQEAATRPCTAQDSSLKIKVTSAKMRTRHSGLEIAIPVAREGHFSSFLFRAQLGLLAKRQ